MTFRARVAITGGLVLGLGGVAGAFGGIAPVRAAPAPDGAPPAATAAAPDSMRPPEVGAPEARAKGIPFGPGESLRFSIEYGILKAGTAWLEVLPMEDYRGRKCFHLVSRAESNDFMSSIYKVRDRIDSLVDLEGLFSLRYRKHLSEGSYRKDYDVLYDPARGKAHYGDGRSYDMRLWSKDGLAAFYFVRALPLTVGQDIVIPHHSDQSSESIIVHVLRKERVTVPAGTFDCIVIEPVMSSGSIFKSTGRLTIWVTDDARRMPVLMKSKIPVGSIDAVLQAYRAGGPAPASEAHGEMSAPGANTAATSNGPRPGL